MNISFNGKPVANDHNIVELSVAEQVHPEITGLTHPRDTLGTLLMVDRDAPQGLRLHYLVVNLSGESEKGRDGQIISSYESHNPPAGSGYHTYEFRWYIQPAAFLKIPIPKRSSFDLSEFESAHQLKLLETKSFRTIRK